MKDKNVKILIIDDQVANTQLLENFLDLNGYEQYQSLNDSRKALELIETYNPDLILLDIMMPFIGGLEILKSLGESGKLDSPMQIMVLTADVTKDTLVKVLASGANDLLRKPFDLVELELRIRNLLHTNELLKRLEKVNFELEKLVDERTKKLMRKNAELEQFIYVASHDTQEPLRMITGFLNLFEKKFGHLIDEKGKEYIDFAILGAERMQKLIKEMLDFSRAERDLEEQAEYIDLNEVMDDILILLKRNIEKTETSITYENLPIIRSYYAPIRQALQNIIINAIMYQPKGQRPEINIYSEDDINEYRVYIADNGIGILPKDQDKIFDIFTRLHRREEYEGTGLGLSLSKKMIEKSGGRISLNSELGKGSAFCIHFPKQLS